MQYICYVAENCGKEFSGRYSRKTYFGGFLCGTCLPLREGRRSGFATWFGRLSLRKEDNQRIRFTKSLSSLNSRETVSCISASHGSSLVFTNTPCFAKLRADGGNIILVVTEPHDRIQFEMYTTRGAKLAYHSRWFVVVGGEDSRRSRNNLKLFVQT